MSTETLPLNKSTESYNKYNTIEQQIVICIALHVGNSSFQVFLQVFIISFVIY